MLIVCTDLKKNIVENLLIRTEVKYVTKFLQDSPFLGLNNRVFFL